MRSYRPASPQGVKPLPRSFRPVNGHYSTPNNQGNSQFISDEEITEKQNAIKRILAIEPKAFYALNQVSDHIVIMAQKLFGYGNRSNIADYKTSELRQLASFLELEENGENNV